MTALAARPVAPAARQRLRLWLRLLRTTRMIEGEVRHLLRTEFATTLPRFDVMAALDRARDGLTMTGLSRQLVVSNGNITAIVDRLVQERLVERTAIAGDRRAHRIVLTAAGQAEFETMAQAHARWIDRRLAALSAKDAALAVSLLEQLAKGTAAPRNN